MPINSSGEEVDDLEIECAECGSSDVEPADEEHEAYLAYICNDCGYMHM